MLYSLIACLFFITVWGRNLDTYNFNDYTKEFRKSYGNDYQERRSLFERRLLELKEHNSIPNVSYTKGVNHMMDWTDAELRNLLGYHKGMGSARRAAMPPAPRRQIDLSSLPESVDWRDNRPSVITPVKNQGHCGSCWTFAAAETIESHWALATGSLQELSQQQIAGCTENPLHCGGTGGCEGGIAQLAFESVAGAGGIATEWTYPYISYYGTNFDCVFNSSKMDIGAVLSSKGGAASHVDLPSNDYASLMEAVATIGPISISVDASEFHSYEKGVFTGCNLIQPDINHAVQLVGYGMDTYYGPYWLVRNSWGTGWGENGYIRIKRDVVDSPCAVDITPQDGSGCDGGPTQITVCGECGILYDNTYPIVQP
jgi:cathepsin L